MEVKNAVDQSEAPLVESANPDSTTAIARPIHRRPGWLLILFLSAGMAVAFFLGVHFLYEGGVVAFAADYANLAGVFGLAVSAVGFFLTLWVLKETEHVNAEASRRIESAVEAAQIAVKQVREEGRRHLQGAALRVLAADVDALLRLAKDAQDGIERQLWSRVIDRCGEAKLLAIKLHHSPFLRAEEKMGLVDGSAALALMMNFVREGSVEDGKRPRSLIRGRKPLGKLVDLAANIAGRLIAESFQS